MPKKPFSSERIVTKLRQIEVLIMQGKGLAVVCMDAKISERQLSELDE